MADPADDDQNQLAQEAADLGAQDERQTPDDNAEARPEEQGEQPQQAGDDSDQTSDPLVLAQMEPEARADQPAAKAADQAAKPTPTTKPHAAAKPGKDDKPKAAADTAKQPEAKNDTQDDPEMAEALGDLPPDDWTRISHKGKSQYLSQRKLIKNLAEERRAERKAREEAEGRYQAVEKFIREEHGLEDEEYVNAMAVSGAIKRADPRVIPVLETTIKNLRRALGQPETPVQPAQLDDDLAAVLREAEEFGIDTAKVRARFQQSQAPAQPAAPAEPPARQPAAKPAQPVQHPQQSRMVDEENDRILSYLQKRGVSDPVVRVSELIAANPELANVPPGERYEAIIEAHSKVGVRQQPQPRRPVSAPMSGRGGPVRQAGATGPIDPLKHAIRR